MKKQTFLVLVRHGESIWNAKGLWTGWQDIGLSARGRKEAKKVARALRHIHFNVAFSSDLKRTYETLGIIMNQLNLTGIPAHRHKALKERHYGEFTGKNKWDIQKSLGEAEFKRIRRGWDVPIPHGETLKMVYDRVSLFFDQKIKPLINEGKNVLIVAHGNTIRTLIKHLEKIPDELIADIELATGEIVIYEFDHTKNLIQRQKKGGS